MRERWIGIVASACLSALNDMRLFSTRQTRGLRLSNQRVNAEMIGLSVMIDLLRAAVS